MDGRTDSAITICLPKFLWGIKTKLEDLKVLRRSPDFLYNVNIVEGQLQLFVFCHICGWQPFWSSDLNNLMNNPSNSHMISEKKMFR